MRNKAAFLDRDGTINVEKGYLYKSEYFEYLEGVKDALRLLESAGYLLIVVTNQSGIARGYYSENDYRKLEKWMMEDLEKDGIHITASYYCPHYSKAKIVKYRKSCSCRKPELGLYKKAILEHDIDLDRSVAIGDKIRDLAICTSDIACKTQGYLIYSTKQDEEGENIHYLKGGLLEAAEMIVNQAEI